MEMWTDVKKFRDGDSLNAKTLNVPVRQLGDRTEYLYSRLIGLIDGDRLSSVVMTGVALSTKEGDTPDVGNAVYLHQQDGEETLVASKAKATMSLYDDFTAADSAFTVGILQSKTNGATGNVVVYGRMNLAPDGTPVREADMIEDGETYRPGRYYLSANEAGKLTANPNGPRIYVCSIGGNVDSSGAFDGIAVVNPQFLDIGTSHVHRTAVIKARPAGELSGDGKSVLGYGTITPGPFHLIFGGTWTGDGTVSYRFKLGIEVVPGEDAPSYSLYYAEGPSQEFVAAERGEGLVFSVSNGLSATLVVDGGGSGVTSCDLEGTEQATWAALDFPEAGQGWVDHVASDEDEYPNALYDYVLGMDPQVANFWPPVPPKSAALLVNGVEMDNAALFPEHPTVAFGKKTIHWFEAAAGRKPWPDDLNADPAYDKVMAMHWVRGFQGATGPVTSIQPKPGSPLKIYAYGTNDAANVGDLEIDAEVDFEIEDGGAPGYMVPKRSENGKLIAGPVVERVVPGPGISLVSRYGSPDGQGTVVIGLDNGSFRSQFEDIALENAEQAKIGMFPYVRLKGYSGSAISSPSAFTATMRVPTNLPDGNYALRVFGSVFAENGFSGAASIRYACLSMSYSILPDFSATGDMMYRNLKTSLLKPDGPRTVYVPFGHEDSGGVSYNGFDPVFVTTENGSLENKDDVVAKVLGKNIPYYVDFSQQGIFPELKPGYLVGIRFARAVTQDQGKDPYAGPLGFVNLSWEIVSVG